jgi:photosystem II stability/assembly factor-like uncharacterized protein
MIGPWHLFYGIEKMAPPDCRNLCTLFFVVLMACARPAAAIDLLEQPSVQSGAATRTLLLDVTTRDRDSYVAVGTFGVIVVTEDDGSSWQQAAVPVSIALTGVYFPTPQKGWAVGHDGVILHSSDGGKNWQKQLDGYQLNEQIIAVAERIVGQVRSELEELEADENADEYDIEDAEFALEEAEFMLEGAMDDIDAGPVRPLLDVWFRDETTGFVTGSYGMLLHTDDGGETWTLVSDRMDNPEAFHLNQIQRAPDGVLFIAGESGQVFRSFDDGESWDSLEPGYPGSWYGLVIVPRASSGYELIVYGLQGNVYRSTDQGETWRQVDVGTQVTLTTGMLLADGSVVLAGHGGTLLMRGSGQQQFQQVDNPDRRVIAGIEQKSNGNLIVVGLGGIRVNGPNGMPLNHSDNP